MGLILKIVAIVFVILIVVVFGKRNKSEWPALFGIIAIALFQLMAVFDSKQAQSNFEIQQEWEKKIYSEEREYIRWRALPIQPKESLHYSVNIKGTKRQKALSMNCYRIDVFPAILDKEDKIVNDVLLYKSAPITYDCNPDFLDEVDENNKLRFEFLLPNPQEYIAQLGYADETGDRYVVDSLFVQIHYWHSNTDEKEFRVEGQIPLGDKIKFKPTPLNICGWVPKNSPPFQITCNLKENGL